MSQSWIPASPSVDSIDNYHFQILCQQFWRPDPFRAPGSKTPLSSGSAWSQSLPLSPPPHSPEAKTHLICDADHTTMLLASGLHICFCKPRDSWYLSAIQRSKGWLGHPISPIFCGSGTSMTWRQKTQVIPTCRGLPPRSTGGVQLANALATCQRSWNDNGWIQGKYPPVSLNLAGKWITLIGDVPI